MTTVHPNVSAPVNCRLLACWQRTRRADFETHLQQYGPLPFPRQDRGRFAEQLREEVRRSGLTGRGGGGFPTSLKWKSVRDSHRPILVVNAMEGEPASHKDAVLLLHAPHLVLDGVATASIAIRARQAVVCVPTDRPTVAHAVENAIRERSARGEVYPELVVQQAPPGFLAGEESALVSWLSNGEARPSFRPEKGIPLRLGRRPTLVHNPETLANVALIARHGAAWFRSAGTPDAPGTVLVTASGDGGRPLVYEVEFGIPLRQVLELAGAGPDLEAVLLGGYGGGWLGPPSWEVAYSPGALDAVGAALGAGVVVTLPRGSCGVAETARIAAYMSEEGAGQCGPCIFGLPALSDGLAALARGRAGERALSSLRRNLAMVDRRGACRHPDGVVRMVRSALSVFEEDFSRHARGAACEGSHRPSVLPGPNRIRRGRGR